MFSRQKSLLQVHEGNVMISDDEDQQKERAIKVDKAYFKKMRE